MPTFLAAIPRSALYWAIVALSGLLAGSGAQLLVVQSKLGKERTARAEQSAAWATERTRLTAAALEASERARSTEEQRRADLARAQEQRDAEIARANAAAMRSADTVQRLRDSLAIAAAAIRSAGRADPAAARVGEAGATSAELLGACAARYRAMAAEADRSHAAGQQCEQSYDALTAKQVRP